MELLQNVKKGIADVVTAKKRLQLQPQKLEQQVVKLDTQARQALAAGNEELARTALERKQFAQTELQSLDPQVAELEAQQQQLIDKEQKLRGKIEQFRTKKEVIKAQYSAAEAQVKISEAATGVGEEMADVGLAMQRAQDKTETMRARASAMEELEESGAFDDNLTLDRGPGRHRPPARRAHRRQPGRQRARPDEGGAGPGPRRRRALGRGGAAQQQQHQPGGRSDRPDRDRGPVPAAGRGPERLNELDNDAVAAVEAGDEPRFHGSSTRWSRSCGTDGRRSGGRARGLRRDRAAARPSFDEARHEFPATA